MRSGWMLNIALIGGCFVATIPGCNGSAGTDATPGSQSAVAQVGKMLAVYRKGGVKFQGRGPKSLPVYRKGPVPPPSGIQDLEPMAKGFPLAYGALRNKDVLIYWRTDLSDDPEVASVILVYAREVPRDGGEVLMRDGSIRRMSAGEFLEARKPPGATTDDSPTPAAPKANR